MAATQEGYPPRHKRSFAEKSRVPAILGLLLFLWFAATMVSCSREQAEIGQEDPSMPMGQIPPMIEGYPVDVQETGEFRKLDPG